MTVLPAIAPSVIDAAEPHGNNRERRLSRNASVNAENDSERHPHMSLPRTRLYATRARQHGTVLVGTYSF